MAIKDSVNYDRHHDTAEEIAQLRAELEEARVDKNHLHEIIAEQGKKIVEYESNPAFKQIKAERDAAVADLKNATTNRPKTCRHYAECYQKCYEAIKIMPCVTCDKWQWRGPEKEVRP